MDYTYIKENCNNTPNNKEEFLENFESICNALDVEFKNDYGYKNMSYFLLELFGSLVKYQRKE